jgi:glutamate formiminotransferase/formiminotetrahydrofolate cyclodeaminase
MKQLIECVPNFSEGRNMAVIKQITDQIESVEGVRLLDVDPGAATNRTVVTFVGEPRAVVEAAFLAVKKASEVIDMRYHKGEHPRFGATDVCPLVPIAGISMEEVAGYAVTLGERIGKELGIRCIVMKTPLSHQSADNLANNGQANMKDCLKTDRSGLEADFGPAEFNDTLLRLVLPLSEPGIFWLPIM